MPAILPAAAVPLQRFSLDCMVAIGLSAGGVARVRFAISPLWETIASIRVLRDPGAHAIHLPWARRVRPRLGALVGSNRTLLQRSKLISGGFALRSSCW